jgi:hypothetical protein
LGPPFTLFLNFTFLHNRRVTLHLYYLNLIHYISFSLFIFTLLNLFSIIKTRHSLLHFFLFFYLFDSHLFFYLFQLFIFFHTLLFFTTLRFKSRRLTIKLNFYHRKKFNSKKQEHCFYIFTEINKYLIVIFYFISFNFFTFSIHSCFSLFSFYSFLCVNFFWKLLPLGFTLFSCHAFSLCLPLYQVSSIKMRDTLFFSFSHVESFFWNFSINIDILVYTIY